MRQRSACRMGELPEGVRGRVLAVLLLLAVIGAVWAGVAVPLSDWYRDRADAIDRQAILARRMTQIAGELPTLRQRVAATQATKPVTVLEGASDAVAGAALQTRLQQIAGGIGASLASTEVLPGEQVGAYRRIGIRLALSAPWPVVVRLLDAVDANTPRLLVNDLQVQSARAIMTDADPGLTASMVVFGFRSGSAS